MDGVLAKLDWPPVWTAAAVALVWAGSLLLPWQVLGLAGPVVGKWLVWGGFLLMGVAAVQMVLARTTVIPRRDPSRLVTGGIFALSRNPIYLGDALVLAGACLWLQVPWALPMVAAFGWVIETRFIRDEEARLEAAFGPEFRLWSQGTRRWFGNRALAQAVRDLAGRLRRR